MRIAINAQRLAGQRLGVARYIEYIVKNWDTQFRPDDKATLYIREPLANGDLGLSDAFQVQRLQPALTGMLWEHLLLAGRARQESDVLFCPSYTMPLNYTGRCVLAIHSANEAESGTHPWWHRLTYAQRYRLSALKADIVVAPSLSTKEDLQKLYGLPEKKVVAIHLGADDAFRPLRDETVLAETRRKLLGDDRPYILFVGKLSQRRNIPLLLAAFSQLRKDHHLPHRLLLFGPNHLHLPLARLAAELDIADSLVQTDGQVSHHHELVALYNAADLFVHPSSYEGFCLPLVEALACGVPVVTVNKAALGEIAQNGALLIDEPTVESLAQAMWQALGDPILAQELRARAVERARAFRWDECARQTLDILREVGRSA
ncbi:MAG: glycosyltransferase family 4 protein [Chloroflexi bacterium]|nr:glycosyltransferase family 4 protein [Chloroflexota bacterium]MCI0578394.1 glycosyltransferase family 4 protein [Chloroflexota bacterium]MCI0647609.1 glycosyltransferase family 4 protein [Chloroflexota bacterium]MCI0730422.1 glycosyltransferase family 4 protein [Chloroflexota bacterium]